MNARKIGSWAFSVLGILALVGMIVLKGDEITHALSSISPLAAAMLIGTAVIALIMRVETWGVLMDTDEHRVPRNDLHLASSASFGASLAAPPWAATALRMGILRRRWRTNEGAPCLQRMFGSEAVIYAVEVGIAATMIIAITPMIGLPAIYAVGMGVGAALVMLAALIVSRRRPDHRFVAPMATLQRGRLTRVVSLLAAVHIIGALRFAVALGAVGLSATIPEAAGVFLLAGILGALPTGAASGCVAACVMIFGGNAGPAAAAALMLAGTHAIAAVIYAGGCALLILTRMAIRRVRAAEPASELT